jgi:hypothetical protein
MLLTVQHVGSKVWLPVGVREGAGFVDQRYKLWTRCYKVIIIQTPSPTLLHVLGASLFPVAFAMPVYKPVVELSNKTESQTLYSPTNAYSVKKT